MELVVLPGLDGTATLHAQFAEVVSSAFAKVTVVAYPRDAFLDYPALTQLVLSHLPADASFVLLGESFSGPIALAIAANPPRNLVGLVLSTTFARSPVPFAGLLSALAELVPVRMAPQALISWLLLGRWSTVQNKSALRNALLAVDADVLRRRAQATLRIDATHCLRNIGIPTLYLRATRDRLLLRTAERRVVDSIFDIEAADIAGPHLLLQTAPEASAGAIIDWARRKLSAFVDPRGTAA